MLSRICVLALIPLVTVSCTLNSKKIVEFDSDEVISIEVEGPSIKLAQSEVELGVIPVDVSEVVGPVAFFNRGSEKLEIINITGSCSCFKGYDGDRFIEPGGKGELFVSFDKSEIETGLVRREVTLMTNDPANETVEVFFDFTVQRDALSEEVWVLRSEIATLRKEVHFFRGEMKKLVTVLSGNRKPAASTAGKGSEASIYDVSIGHSPVLGSKDAPVTIVEFVDLQCPYCAREYPKIKDILKEYNGKVNVAFKHFPLSFHKKAKPAHAATEFAKRQSGNESFWKMHDMIMANPRKLEITDLRGYAQKLGLDLEKFDALMANEANMNELLRPDIIEAQKCHVRGTPTILINGLKLADRSMEGYKKRIDTILAKKVATGPKKTTVKHE